MKGTQPKQKYNRPKIGRYKGIDEARAVALFSEGLSREKVGQAMGISPHTVTKILAEKGIDYLAVAQAREDARKQKGIDRTALLRQMVRDARAKEYYGCTHAELVIIIGDEPVSKSKIAKAYTNQKRRALARGVGFQMTLPEWWQVWQESGKWEQRGRGQGYCMARKLDIGPYAVSNVYICTIGQNFSDSYITKPYAMRKAKMGQPKPEKVGRSVNAVNAGRKPYQAAFGRIYLGAFCTKEEANAAYEAAPQPSTIAQW